MIYLRMVIFQFVILVYWRVTIKTIGVLHGSLNVPIEHHPTMNGIWSTRWLLFQVMSNIPKMGQLPTPVVWYGMVWYGMVYPLVMTNIAMI